MSFKTKVHPMTKCNYWLALMVCICVGCGDPISQVAGVNVPKDDVQLVSSENAYRYDWPLTRDRYLVVKPPQMAYVTSFPKKFSLPNPNAKLVPWDDEGLSEVVQVFLRLGYDPPSRKLQSTVKLSRDQYHGEQAFDVSQDGTRLVVIDDEGLAMYRTEDGGLIGHMKLPSVMTSLPSPPTAVRFAGQSNDMLIGSADKICRISSKDGSVVGQTDGCGELIAQWDVTGDDTAMLIRGESGRLFGGDPQLEYFAQYHVGKNKTFDAASLSFDGSRIGVVVDNRPTTFTQKQFHIVDETTYENATLDPGLISIGLGSSSDAWADGDGIFFTTPKENGDRSTGIFHMFWKPLRLSATKNDDGASSCLVVGSRFVNGKEELVLFAFGPISRNHSVPHPLTELPARMAHDSSGAVIALADSQGLRVVRRETWVTTGLSFPDYMIYDLVDEAKFEEIETLLRIVKSQKRNAYGRTPEDIRYRVIDAAATRWRWLDQNAPDGDYFKQVEEWRKKGSMLALLCSAWRHYKRGWNARGSGTVETVTQNGWQEYRQRLDLATKELDEVFKLDSEPPLAAFDLRVLIGTSHGELEKMDPFCQRAMALYPGEDAPHEAVAFKLLPQWFGEPGDFVSFVLSVSKMVDGPDSDWFYARLISGAVDNVPRSKTEWNSYDRNKHLRGIEVAIRQEAHGSVEIWRAWRNFMYTNDQEAGDRVIELIMGAYPAIPTSFDQYSSSIHSSAEKIRGR